MPEDPRLLFIGGLGRSGSTIVDLMLGQVPGFVAVGELAYLWGRSDADLCGCGRPFADCPFWTAVGEEAYGGWSKVDRPRLAAIRIEVERNRQIPALMRRRPVAGRRRDLDDAIRRLHRAIATVSGSDVVIDSTKHPASAFHLHAMGADLRVIHLLRDPRGVAYSWTKIKERPGIAGGAMMDRYPPWRIAGRWLSFNGAFHILEHRGVPTLRLRYEDLVDEPTRWLSRVVSFSATAAIDASTTTTFHFLNGRTVALAEAHTIAGNPMRFERGSVELRSDDAWHSRLPARDRRRVTTIDLPLLRRYGYRG
jgi:hypothetical protein